MANGKKNGNGKNNFNNTEDISNGSMYNKLDNNSLNKQTRADHYEMLYQKVLEEIKTGKGSKKKTTIVILDDLWKLANIEAAFQEKNLSDVITQSLVHFIKTSNGE